MTVPDLAGLPAAADCGRICAQAGRGQREMRAWAAGYPRLYGAKAFDPALFSTLALAAAFSGPWFGGGELRMANRVCLWCFGLDWLVDYAATSRVQVERLVRRCLDVADGAPAVAAGEPGEGAADGVGTAEDELALFLAEIRDELAEIPAFATLRPVWRDELRRMLDAMAREWDWKEARSGGATGGPTGGPTFEEYLGNADNLGFSFVFTAHWISTGDGTGGHGAARPPGPAEIADVRAASAQVQRIIRLLNDLGTYERDLEWGDLNALMLGATRADVDQAVAGLRRDLRGLLEPVRAHRPRLAAYMERQVEFCVGFYGVTDYWGAL